MDELKTIYLLRRIPDTKKLQESSELSLKDKDRTHLKINRSFQSIIMGEEYLILESKIFYLQKDKQIANGILDMEKLNKTK
jgi:hypothetical protein